MNFAYSEQIVFHTFRLFCYREQNEPNTIPVPHSKNERTTITISPVLSIPIAADGEPYDS